MEPESQRLDEFFNNAAIDHGYDFGLSSPCLCLHREEDSHGERHADDLVFEGEGEWLDDLQKELGRVMFLKRLAILGWQASDDKRVTILNRLIDFRDSGGERVVTLEPDPRHMDLLRETCGLSTKSRAVTTLGDNSIPIVNDEAGILLRSQCSRLWRTGLRYTWEKPTFGAWNRLKRCARYIHGRWIHKIPIQDEVHRLAVCTDSDWVRDQDRENVSCVVTMMGTHCLRVQDATQAAPALSSGDSEFVAEVEGASAGIGMQSMARDVG